MKMSIFASPEGHRPEWEQHKLLAACKQWRDQNTVGHLDAQHWDKQYIFVFLKKKAIWDSQPWILCCKISAR